MNRNILSQSVACIAAVSFASVASAQFADDFDSYAANTAIEGVNGWQNWDVCALGNQIINTVSTAQAASGANSLRMVGGNCGFCSDTTHELNGPYNSGQWTLSMNTYIPSSFAGDAYFIVLNTYNNCGGPYGWSAQVRINTAGQIAPDDLQGNTTINGPQTVVYDTWVELKMAIDLDANNVVYSYGGVDMFSAPWNAAAGSPIEIAALDLFPGTDDTTEYFVDDISLTAGIDTGPIGTNYCTANANSTGATGVMGALGSAEVAANDLTLTATSLPPLAFGFFITSPLDGFVANPGGSDGNLCLAGAIGRYVGPGQIQNSGTAGEIQLLIDNTAIPTPVGPVAATIGETRFFQLWHRDSGATGPTSNFTDGLEITFE